MSLIGSLANRQDTDWLARMEDTSRVIGSKKGHFSRHTLTFGYDKARVLGTYMLRQKRQEIQLSTHIDL